MIQQCPDFGWGEGDDSANLRGVAGGGGTIKTGTGQPSPRQTDPLHQAGHMPGRPQLPDTAGAPARGHSHLSQPRVDQRLAGWQQGAGSLTFEGRRCREDVLWTSPEVPGWGPGPVPRAGTRLTPPRFALWLPRYSSLEPISHTGSRVHDQGWLATKEEQGKGQGLSRVAPGLLAGQARTQKLQKS